MLQKKTEIRHTSSTRSIMRNQKYAKDAREIGGRELRTVKEHVEGVGREDLKITAISRQAVQMAESLMFRV